jgi:hypothetical protein
MTLARAPLMTPRQLQISLSSERASNRSSPLVSRMEPLASAVLEFAHKDDRLGWRNEQLLLRCYTDGFAALRTKLIESLLDALASARAHGGPLDPWAA